MYIKDKFTTCILRKEIGVCRLYFSVVHELNQLANMLKIGWSCCQNVLNLVLRRYIIFDSSTKLGRGGVLSRDNERNCYNISFLCSVCLSVLILSDAALVTYVYYIFCFSISYFKPCKYYYKIPTFPLKSTVLA